MISLGGIASRIEIDQLVRHVPDRPANATFGFDPFANPKVLRAGRVHGRIDRDAMGLVYWHIEALALGELEQQILALDPSLLHANQTLELGDPMIDMDDVVPWGQRLGECPCSFPAFRFAGSDRLVESI